MNCKIIALCLLKLFLASCSNKTKSDETTIFTGRILNNATNEIRIENQDTVYKSLVDENGKFKIKFRLDDESLFTYVGNEFTTIHLSPGDSIFMSVDARTWREFDKTLIFSGKGSEKNKYYFHKSLLIDELIDSKRNELFSMNENEYLVALDSACTVLNEYYKEFVKENPHVAYKRLNIENESIEYLRKDNILQYFLFHQKTDNEFEKITTIIDEIISNIDLNNKNHILLDTYNQLIIDYFRYKLYINKFDNDDKKFAFVLANIDNSVENENIKSSVLKYFIKKWIAENNVNESTLKVIKNQLNPNLYYQFLQIFNEENPLVIHDKAPEFHLYDINGNEYTSSRFKGNYIYIDVWASYCSPCLKEIPYFEQLKKDFQGKNISFISISLDRKEKNWLNTIDKYKMSEFQLRPKDDWSSDFVNDYSINHYGIPHYIIIDPRGNIVKMPGPEPSKATEYLKQIK